MHRIPNLCFSLRINAMKPDFPIVYSLKGSDFSLLYVSSRITIGNYISNLKFVHFYLVIRQTKFAVWQILNYNFLLLYPVWHALSTDLHSYGEVFLLLDNYIYPGQIQALTFPFF